MGLLLCAAFLSLSLGGDANYSPAVVLQQLFGNDGSQAGVLIHEYRIPRTLGAFVTGSALAVAGAIMQSVTRNPLASPGIFGINAGGTAAVTCALVVLGGLGPVSFLWTAFAGAALAGAIVYAMASLGKGGLTPMRMTIAGAAIAAMFNAVTFGALTLSQQTMAQALPFLAGSLAGSTLEKVLVVLPSVAVGMVLAMAISRSLTSMTLGDETARALGVQLTQVRLVAGLVVVLLAGSAVAVAGPITFVGLAVPHIARRLASTDYRRMLPHAAMLGAILMSMADVLGRVRLGFGSSEVPVGIITALLGVPVFVHFVRKGVTRQ
jgi:iron complex transport system permease protein